MSTPILVGVALALGCLGYVLYPIVVGRGTGRAEPASGSSPAGPGPLRDVTDDEIEAAIRSYRTAPATTAICPVCGPRPEPAALYCSSCGRRLDG